MIAVRTFAPPYASSRKKPDQCILPGGLAMPTVVIESGWSKSRPHLLQDMKLWLQGGRGTVQLVFIFNWSKVTGNRVKGVVELYNLNQAGNENLIQAVVIINLSNIKLMADKKIGYFPSSRDSSPANCDYERAAIWACHTCWQKSK
jgi:hypothetical protein